MCRTKRPSPFVLLSLVATIVTAVVLPEVSSAAVLRVARDGSQKYTEIQAAVEAAAPGDTILVGPGRFDQSARRPRNSGGFVEAIVALSKPDLVLIGAGADSTIIGHTTFIRTINQLGTAGVFVDEDSPAHISGLLIENVSYPVTLMSTAVVEHCTIIGVDPNPFAVNARYADDVVIRDCAFDTRSGAIAFWGGDRPLVQRCTFDDPTHRSYAVLFTYGSQKGLAVDCTFTRGLAGVSVQYGAQASIERCFFEGLAGVPISSSNAGSIFTVRDCAMFGRGRFGVFAGGHEGRVERSTIAAGVFCTVFAGSPLEIRDSNILPPVMIGVKTQNRWPGEYVDARDNWWGTTVADSVRVSNIDPNGRVFFLPMRDEPVEVEVALRRSALARFADAPELPADWVPESKVLDAWLGDPMPPPILDRSHGVETHSVVLGSASASGLARAVMRIEPVYGGRVRWGDFDADGYPDLMVSGLGLNDSGRSLRARSDLYRNEQAWLTRATDLVISPAAEVGAQWCDLEGDGDLDLALWGGWSSSSYDVYEYDGEGFRALRAEIPLMTGTAVAWGDWNNDGSNDLLVAGHEHYTVIGHNDGGVISRVPLQLPVAAGGAADWVDVDGDGTLDLFLCGYDTRRRFSRIYENRSGQLVDSGVELVGVNAASADWGDYDGDGDPDLALCGLSEAGPVTAIYRNEGAMRFKRIAVDLPDVFDGEIVWVDFDNDGDLDLGLTGRLSAERSPTRNEITRFYINTNGRFTELDIGLPDVGSSSLDFADFEGDGDLDLVLVGMEGRTRLWSALYLNDLAPAPNTPPAAPSSLSSHWEGRRLTMSWSAGSDLETPTQALTYNLQVGSEPGAQDVMPSQSIAASGARMIPRSGNVGSRLSWTLELAAEGPFHWSVQTVDAGFGASEFMTAVTEPNTVSAIVLRVQREEGCRRVSWFAPRQTPVRLERLVSEQWARVEMTSNEQLARQLVDCSDVVSRYRLLDGEGNVLALSDELDDGLPSARGRIRSAHPNPANPSLTIEFGVPSSGRVDMEVLDLRGRRVRTLVSGHLEGGVHHVQWDGRDANGVGVVSGVYLVRFSTSGVRDERKITFVR